MSALGAFNFVVLQWFGVRLARITCRNCTKHTHRRCRHHRPWRVLRWLVPMTGWLTDYRWIARRR